MFLGLKFIDLSVIVCYFAGVMAIGFWASSKVHNDEDFFLGGRKFGKGLLMMHWLCTGTHSEMAVQVSGATARVGLGGIWYQWMYLFSTPFYWLIGPVMRRLRVITTGDFFRVRYGRGLEMAYTAVALTYVVLSIAMLLRGAAAAIAGATGGALPTEQSVVLLSILFSTYIFTGGLMAAAYTDFLQGIMIIVLSIMLVPLGLEHIGGMTVLHERLGSSFMSLTAPVGAKEGDPWFVIAMSILGLVGIVAQPHVMTATGSGKSEIEARMGMCYGNFIKRLLTIAWAFTGLIAVVMYGESLADSSLTTDEITRVSETFFGHAVQELLGDGWRGLMIACIIAGVTSAETFMVVGSGVFTRNLYVHAVPGQQSGHYLWVGRAASIVILVVSIAVAFLAGSVTQLVIGSVQVIGLLGPSFWLGVTWRRANRAGAWASFLIGVTLLAATHANAGEWYSVMRNLDKPTQMMIILLAQFGAIFLVSMLTPPQSANQLDPFYARLFTPVGREQEMILDVPEVVDESADLGMHGMVLDYEKASQLAYAGLRRFGFEIPRLTFVDWTGFLGAWALVGALIGLVVWLSRLGMT